MALNDNAALNSILDKVILIEKNTRNGYTNISGQTFTVSLADPITSPAMPSCVRSVVTNLGAVSVRIYENGKLVNILPAGKTWESPTSGAGAIKVDTAGAGSNISLARYLQ